jgi:hypothetical protein
MAAVMVLCGTCRASLFRPHYDHVVTVLVTARSPTPALSRMGRGDGVGPTTLSGDHYRTRANHRACYSKGNPARDCWLQGPGVSCPVGVLKR